MMRRPLRVASLAFAACFFLSVAQAATILDGVGDSSYTALGSSYSSSVGYIYETVGSTTYIGSGTVISATSSGVWVLTAAHVVDDSSASLSFTINGSKYSASSYYWYSSVDNSNCTSSSVGDLGLVFISTAISGVTAATLYTGSTSDLVGQTATFVGYGNTGTGSTGSQSKTYGMLRAVQNVLDCTASTYDSGFSDSVLLSDFDSANFRGSDNTLYGVGSSATPLSLEGLIAGGDSGGGVFVTIDGVEYLVGVNSYCLAIDDRNANSDYGDMSGCVSICDYINWIEETTGLSFTTASVPEGSTLSLLMAACLTLGVYRRFLRRKA
ncbi:MAG: trypsin-like serine protease [Planctomycetaceae bacterium]|nr:trypsin-like serine protease [Planctomycetaceae bacterium]